MLLSLCKDIADIPVGGTFDLCAEAHALFVCALFDYLIKTVECAAADKEDIGRIDLYKLLMRVLASALGRNIGDSALKQLQKRLLHTFAGNIPRDGCILALASDLIDLININNTLFGTLNIKIGSLQKS